MIPLWSLSGNPFEEELAFVYAVGKQVAAEELARLENIFAFELRADRTLSAILSGRDAREAVEAGMSATGAREVLAVARLAASHDLLERGSETLPRVVRSLSASFPELDEHLLKFKRHYASLQLAALYASGLINTLFSTHAEALAAALGDERAKPDDALASRIASEIFGVSVPATHTALLQVEEIALPLAQAGERAESWRTIFYQLVSRFEDAGKADARALAAVLVREAILSGVDPATIDLSSIDAERPLDAWRRYLKLEWRLNFVYFDVWGEFEVRLERRYDYATLARLSRDAVLSMTREKLIELLHRCVISSGSKPTDVSDGYLKAEIAQLADSIIQHAQRVQAPPVKRAPAPLAAKKVEVSGIPVELNLYKKRRRLYLEIRISSAPKFTIRVGQSGERALKRLRNVMKSLPPYLREVAPLLESEIAKFLEDALGGGPRMQQHL